MKPVRLPLPQAGTQTLTPLQALAGEVGMSSELDDVAQALFNGQIPVIWRQLAPDTLKTLGNWIVFFRARYNQYTSWVSECLQKAFCFVNLHGRLFKLVQKSVNSHCFR